MEANTYKFISPFELSENPFDLLDNQWMLILAGKIEKHNSMTASWGGLWHTMEQTGCFYFHKTTALYTGICSAKRFFFT